MQDKPAIIVIAHNRARPLNRLLVSLQKADYPGAIPLVISIDAGDAEDVIRLVDAFRWEHGDKRVIKREENMGLHRHVMACGNLTEEYGTVIVLEDDLYVSRNYYKYALQANEFYKYDEAIAGISLYAHSCIESTPDRFPFLPLSEDEYDAYFLQLASSWGQLWTDMQWKAFREWYEGGDHPDALASLPLLIRIWPDTSWKKYFNAYLIDTGRYFVYPYRSQSTNFGDKGVHVQSTRKFQVPLETGSHEYHFQKLGDSHVIYDAHCELKSDCLSALQTDLRAYDFEVDIYGSKDLSRVDTEYVLTTRPVAASELSFAFDLKPVEMNIILGLEGDVIRLARASDVSSGGRSVTSEFNFFLYFFNVAIPVRRWFGLALAALRQRLKR